MLANLRYINVDSFTVGTFWVDSFGPAKVFDWLVHGEVFDFGRLPIVSLLVAVGVVRVRSSGAAGARRHASRSGS